MDFDSDYSSDNEDDTFDGPEMPALVRPKVVSPLPNVHRDRKAIQKGKVDGIPLLNEVRQYFWFIASNPCHATKNPTRAMKCCCLMNARDWLSDEDIDNVVQYLFDFALLEDKEQRIRLSDWMRYARAINKRYYKVDRQQRRRVYLIPGVNHPNVLICSHAMCALLGKTHNSWDPLWKRCATACQLNMA
jgi:hypothetical protein